MTFITIEITQRHIDRGLAGKCQYCPAALAIRDAIPSLSSVYVTTENIIFEENGIVNYQVSQTPQVLRDFIKNFDSRKEVSPMKFTIEIDEALL